MTSQRIRRIARSGIAAVIAAVGLDPSGLVQGAAMDSIELPPYKGTLKEDYYPADARLHFLQGRALVEFTVNGRGVPADVVVVNSEPPREFADSARRLVKNLRFEVPAGWDQGTAAAHRFRLGVRFQVIECVNLSRCESEPRNPPADYAADRIYVVSTQRRVLSMGGQPAAPPAAAPPAAATPAAATPPRGSPAASPAPAAAPPRPQDHPVAPPEPIYPPG
ncbi:MAG: energy transducer TonB [Steroidobacterales bacterium]